MTIAPQLLTDCKDPDALFACDGYAAEEKMDGDRRIIRKAGNTITARTRNGNVVLLSDTALAVALISDFDWTLDGEMMPGGTFIAFDIPELNGRRIADSNGSRRDLLESVSPFAIVRRAVSEDTKRDLAASVRAGRGEGVVFKLITGEYRSGERCHDWQRFKYYDTDDFTVASVDMARCSVEVARDGKSFGRVACSLNRLPREGDVIRVRFDAITAKGKLLRARLARAAC